MDLVPVQIAVLTIADDAATADRAASDAIIERATSAGHQIVDEELVKDTESAIRDQLVRWIAEPNVDVVIVAAPIESEAASAALAPLVMQAIPGFTDLFRWLTFQEIGASAMQSAAEAALCESTFVFVLPAHDAAARAAMDKLILPQLDARTKPKNLVLQMPRLKAEAKRVQTALQAVPSVIASEKTSSGPGVEPKLPARGKMPTANTIARKTDDPPTKEIDLARLEKQIALSSQHEAQTKQTKIGEHDAKTKVVDMSAHQAKTRVVDMTGRMLPRVPPGADASASDETEDDALSFTQPPRRTTTQALPLMDKLPAPPSAPIAVAVAKTPAPITTPPPVKPLPSLTTPSFATPVSRKTPTGRPAIATPVSTPITTPAVAPSVEARHRAVTPVSEASSAIAARDTAVTPVKPPVVVAPPSIIARPRPPTAPPPPPVKAPAEPVEEELESIEPLEEEKPAAEPTPVVASEPTDYDAVAAPLSAALTQAPVKRRPTTPPIDPLASVTLKPISGGDLPEGDFVYPIKRSGGALLLKIVAALAVLGLGFFAVTQLYPGDEPTRPAVTPEPTPAPIAVAPADAAPAVEPAPVAVVPDAAAIETEPAVAEPAPPTPVATAKPTKPTSSTRPSTKPTTTAAVTKPDPTPTEPAPKQDPEPVGDPSCDEVSCVLAKYDRPCCERYRPKDTFTPTTSTPSELDKRMVKAGVEKIKPRVVACGEQSGANGTVKVAVTVDAGGTVMSASVTESPDPALGECVAAAMRKAKFIKTVNGGEFVYPFVF